MTVIYKSGNETVKTSDVIYANGMTMKKMAAQMIVDTIDGNIEMIMDIPEDYSTKQDIERVISSAKVQCLEMFDDYMDTLRDKLKSAIEATNFTARVVRIDYGKDPGMEFEDIHVEVRVE